MNRFDQQWQKLTAAARRAPAAEESAPYGFAARGVARSSSGAAPWMSLERLALRGFLAAVVCCGGAFAFNFVGFAAESPDVATEDTVSIVLEPTLEATQ